MNIIIIGGTGLLGNQATNVALERGHSVSSLAVEDAHAEEWYSKDAKSYTGDVFSMTEDELYNFFKEGGYDAMIYAVGPDDRYSPHEDAYNFFHEKLVNQCSKVYRAARRAGIKKSSLCSSYFLYFDRTFPKKKLSHYHPYIKVRKEQAEAIIKIATEDNGDLPKMDVYVMELPYIFGTCPYRRPIWRETFLDHFAKGKKMIMFPKGGTVMTTTHHIGEALVGALEYGPNGECKHYSIGDENHDYNWMLDKLLIGIQGKPMKIWNPPKFLCAIGADLLITKPDHRKGIYHGLDYFHLMTDIQSDYFYYPENEIEETCKELHLTRGGVEEAVIESGKACYDSGEWN